MPDGDEALVESFLQRRYRCPWCHRSYSKKSSILGHMGGCLRRPRLRTCASCEHEALMDGFYCRLGIRDDSEQIRFDCESWQRRDPSVGPMEPPRSQREAEEGRERAAALSVYRDRSREWLAEEAMW